MARLEIKQITVLRDNYVYLVNHWGSGTAGRTKGGRSSTLSAMRKAGPSAPDTRKRP